MSKTKEVLLIAFAISPTEGSESGAGWALLRAHLYAGTKVTLLTTESELIKLKQSREFTDLNLKAIGISEIHLIRKFQDFIPFSFQIRHLFWNLLIINEVRSLAVKNSNLIIHYGTYAGDWNITVLHFLHPSILKLWGPIGGAQKIPKSLARTIGVKGIIENFLKNFLGSPFRSFSRRKFAKGNIIVLCANSATFDYYSKSVRTILAQNIVLEDLEAPNQNFPTIRSNIIFGCGRLIPWKNWKLAILAMQNTEEKKLVIAGEGPDFNKLERLIRRKSLESKVQLLGKVSREETLNMMKKCDAFIFLSLRDSASWALAEAVSLNCRIIALDVPGSAAVLAGTGIELISPQELNLVGRIAHEVEREDIRTYSRKHFSLEKISRILDSSITELYSIVKK